jgi:hypothetical protein
VDVYRQAVYPFEGRLADRWRVGRVFLAGDAAHVMTPFLGQGGCSALRDAINLAWKLDLVLRGLAPDRVLDSYEAERKPHVRAYIDASDKLAASAFDGNPALADAGVEPIVTAGVLRVQDGAPVGSVGPQGLVSYNGRTGLFDDVIGRGFQLLGRGFHPDRALTGEQRAFMAAIGATSVELGEGDNAVSDRAGVYERYFEEHEIAGLLMRPDFLVYGVARTPTDIPGLVDSLRAGLAD